jgi:hypothetical protein
MRKINISIKAKIAQKFVHKNSKKKSGKIPKILES